MIDLQSGYNWAVMTCASPTVGYSQDYRNQRTVNGITYYDCSSFIWYALIAAGFDMVSAYNGQTWPFVTGTMENVLKSIGFKKYDPSIEWKPMDILIKAGHTEIAFDGSRTMGAHTSKVPLVDQVSINQNPNRSGWVSLYRYEGSVNNQWIKGNRWLSQGEMLNNASLVFNYLYDKGWSINAIAGLLGNMQKESTINPGIWQNLDSGHAEPWGFGLVQFTPSTKYTDWAKDNGYAADDGTGQLEFIDGNHGEYIPTDAYNLSYANFKSSTNSPEWLAYAFMYNYERPKELNQPERQTYARYWYNWLNNIDNPTPNPPENGAEWKSNMPIWLYIRKRYY